MVVRRSEPGPVGFESAQLLQLDRYRELDGYRVPHAVFTYGPDASTSPWTFDHRRPTFELYVEQGTLGPEELGPSFFTP